MVEVAEKIVDRGRSISWQFILSVECFLFYRKITCQRRFSLLYYFLMVTL